MEGDFFPVTFMPPFSSPKGTLKCLYVQASTSFVSCIPKFMQTDAVMTLSPFFPCSLMGSVSLGLAYVPLMCLSQQV